MSSHSSSAAETLAKPVQYVRGVGPRRAEALAKLGLKTVRDVLFYFPRDWQDLTDIKRIDELEENVPASVRGTVVECEHRTSSGRSRFGVLIAYEGEHLRAMWFNQPFMAERFRRGQEVLLEGKPKKRGLRWEMAHPTVRFLEDDGETQEGRLLPVYRLTEGISQGQVRRVVQAVLDEHAGVLEEVFPQNFLQQQNLLGIEQAVRHIHFPGDRAELEAARGRLVYQELLVMQIALAIKRFKRPEEAVAPPLPATGKIDARIRRLFPFELTEGQEEAIGELTDDLQSEQPMNRLLQGEVGSGKTVVAVYGMLLAVAHGYQTALMAPTEVLARQHWRTIEGLLAHSHVRRELLVGGLPTSRRQAVLERIASGEVDLVVGTQALLQEDVLFDKLGLVVIDEQHKFGVRQRARMKAAGLAPHYLVMTATPIPRTVSMTLYGDLDVSTLRDAPPGRQPVHTYLAELEQREKWWEFFRKKLTEGRQGFVVAPLVESSESVASAEETFAQLRDGALRNFSVGLLHGRLSSEEKDRTVEAFRQKKLDVLVSTSVVEVGVDIPNATLMTIENGERFGLAALHQLRGRISRGKYPGFCCVFADPKTADARERLQAFVDSNDGFELAEIDFQLRGPGHLLGTRQHGLPPMYIADLTRDTQVLIDARRDALTLVAEDPLLENPSLARLRAMVWRRYGDVLDLGDVG